MRVDLTRIGTVVALFAVSCCLPAVYYQGRFMEEGTMVYGWWLLIIGWIAVHELSVPGIGWLANPALAIGIVELLRHKFTFAVVLAITASLLAVIPWIMLAMDWDCKVIVEPTLSITFAHRVDGTLLTRLEFRAGYFIWALSHWVFLVTAFMSWRRTKCWAAEVRRA